MAFGIPIVQRLASEGGQALILVPTRELAVQIADALGPLLQPFKMQIDALRQSLIADNKLDITQPKQALLEKIYQTVMQSHQMDL